MCLIYIYTYYNWYYCSWFISHHIPLRSNQNPIEMMVYISVFVVQFRESLGKLTCSGVRSRLFMSHSNPLVIG